MNNRLIDPAIAVALGTAVGMLLSIFGQKLLNQHYLKACNKMPNHNLVVTQGFLGDTYYCIHRAYLGSTK